jgi:hypothetical protein
VNAGIRGFWDSIYSTLWLDGALSSMIAYDYLPPWNFTPMIAGSWLGLIPTAAIVIGVSTAARGSARRAQVFAVLCLTVFFAAFLDRYLKLPTYAVAKATYTLGLSPCYALLAAAGFRPLLGNRWLRATVYGLLACFGAAAYAAYFVL